jgi:hypothetical protein
LYKNLEISLHEITHSIGSINNKPDGSKIEDYEIYSALNEGITEKMTVEMTGKKKEGKYYFYIGEIDKRESSVILSQIRLLDTKRLVRKMETISEPVFEKIKMSTGNKYIWLRATGSTLISQLIDSFLVIGIAFYAFGDWNISQWMNVSLNNYFYKFFIAILFTPLLYLAHYFIEQYLRKETD